MPSGLPKLTSKVRRGGPLPFRAASSHGHEYGKSRWAVGGSDLLVVGPALGVAVVLVIVAAALVSTVARLGHGPAVLRAGLRAILQLGAVSLIIAAVVSSGPLTFAFVAVMLVVASLTAGRRISPGWHSVWALLSICVPVVPLLGVLLVSGLVPWEGLAIIPLAGILTGGALTATVLAGRRAVDELHARNGEFEAALALGVHPRAAILYVARPAAASALWPALDQTRTVGLVTLPGAFVGMLLGGASPLDAGAVQVFILAALLLIESVAIVITLELVARGALPRATFE